MAVFDLIQHKSAGSVGDQLTLNVVLDSAPQVGNTLIARIATRDQTTDLATPAGFRPAQFVLGARSTLIYYRHVQAGDSQTITVTQGSAADIAMHVEELEGVLVPHKSAFIQNGNNTQNRATGTTPATTVANAVCIASVAITRGDTTGHAWSNGYTLRGAQAGSVGTGGITIVAGDLVVGTTGTQTSTASWSGSATACGAIAVFREGTLQSDGVYADAVKTDSPHSYYRFAEEDQNGPCVDEIGNAHLKYGGNPPGHTLQQAGPIASEPSFAVEFDGVNGTGASLDPFDYPLYEGDATLELWVNTNTPGLGVKPAYVNRDDDVHGTAAFPTPDRVDGSNWMSHYRNNVVIGQDYVFTPIVNDQWDVFWVTYGPAGMHVYGITGGVVGEHGVGRTDITQWSYLHPRIGASQNGAPDFFGLIAELAVYRSVLTTAQMQAHYDAAIASSPGSLGVDPIALQLAKGDPIAHTSWGAFGPGWLRVSPVEAEGQTVAVGQAVESETANPVTPLISRQVTVGTASETETANAITPAAARFVDVGQVTESELARSITPVAPSQIPVGQATESETANPITPATAREVNVDRAVETELARSITPVIGRLVPIGQATETETTQLIMPVVGRVVQIGQAVEVELARFISPSQPAFIPVQTVVERELAFLITPQLGQPFKPTLACAVIGLGIVCETQNIGLSSAVFVRDLEEAT